MKKWKISISGAVSFYQEITVLEKDSTGKKKSISSVGIEINNLWMKKEIESKLRDLLNCL